MSQVALNWIISKGAIPIPGASSVEQVHAFFLLKKYSKFFFRVPGVSVASGIEQEHVLNPVPKPYKMS
jgi:hypothetical protein